SGGTLKIASGVYPPHFDQLQTNDYQTQYVTATAYSTLLRIDPNDENSNVPDLADSFEVTPDGLSVSFKLHPNVKFHDGTSCTSEDVKYSLLRIKEPPTGYISPRQGQMAGISSIETPDPHTVTIKLAAPQAAFPTFI